MKRLNLNFLNTDFPNHSLVNILESYGKEISEYAKDFLSHVVAFGSSDNILTDVSLYIVAPEINTEYKVITIEVIDVENVMLIYTTLKLQQSEKYPFNISKGTHEIENKIKDILDNSLVQASFSHLINLIKLKRASRLSTIKINHISSLEEVEEVRIVSFSEDGRKFKDVRDGLFEMQNFIIKEGNSLHSNFSYFDEDVIFIYLKCKGHLSILFCDKTAVQPFCEWNTTYVKKFDIKNAVDYSKKFMKTYLLNKNTFEPFKNYFNTIS